MGDPDVDRFILGTDVARSLLPSSTEPDGPYADAFTQQIVGLGIEGHIRVQKGLLSRMRLRSEGFLSEGVAFRRLGDNAAFAAANGLDPENVSLQAKRLADADGVFMPAAPERSTRHVPTDLETQLGEFARYTADAILSVLDESRQLTVRISTFSVSKSVANTLGFGETAGSLNTEFRVEIETASGKLSTILVDWGTRGAPSVDPLLVASELRQRDEHRRMTVSSFPPKAAVLLPPGWGGTWMHEAVGHLLEADTVLAGNSPLHAKRGRAVAMESLTIVDDGTLHPSRAGGPFDDEGVPTTLTHLIDRGVVVGLLTDRVSAAKLDMPLTGNGRRPHFGLPPRPRMTNLLLTASGSDRAALILSEDPLLIVDRIENAWMDVRDQRLYLEIDEASLTRGGELQYRLPPIIASAEPLELLAGITALGDDFTVDLHRGYCRKDGAAVPVTIGQPSVLIRSMLLEPRQVP